MVAIDRSCDFGHFEDVDCALLLRIRAMDRGEACLENLDIGLRKDMVVR